MRTFSNASEGAYLLKPEPSGWLTAWWLGLNTMIALSLVLVCPWMLAVPALVVLAIPAWRRRPRIPPLIVHSRAAGHGEGLVLGSGGCWALPQAGLFRLSLSPATRYGRLWVELVFEHSDAPRVLLLRDQLAAPAWRQLRLALTESGRVSN